jgi:hypothetical protein
MTPTFQVWQAPGGCIWEGEDQEEAFLYGLRCRRPGVLIEVVEVFTRNGSDRLRCIMRSGERRQAGASDDISVSDT